MIPSIICNVPPSVELLGITTPIFQTRINGPQISNQLDATALYHVTVTVLRIIFIVVLLLNFST